MDIMTFSLMTSVTALTGSHYEGCLVSYERVDMLFHCLYEHQYIVDIDFFGVRLIFIPPMNIKSFWYSFDEIKINFTPKK